MEELYYLAIGMAMLVYAVFLLLCPWLILIELRKSVVLQRNQAHLLNQIYAALWQMEQPQRTALPEAAIIP